MKSVKTSAFSKFAFFCQVRVFLGVQTHFSNFVSVLLAN